jgi:F0F1-type ATP synthase assembly protein I
METLIIIPILFVIFGTILVGIYIGTILENFIEKRIEFPSEILIPTIIVIFAIIGMAIAIEIIRFLNIYP